MRELKFRAWDKIHDKYREPMVYDILNEKIVARFPIETLKKGEFLLEQYTGLKDKNGKEIYEGDIVKCGAYSGKPIVFEEGRYWLGEEPDDLFVATVRWEIEVIGNIHENPELLEDEK